MNRYRLEFHWYNSDDIFTIPHDNFLWLLGKARESDTWEWCIRDMSRKPDVVMAQSKERKRWELNYEND